MLTIPTLTVIAADDLVHVVAGQSPLAGNQECRSTLCGRRTQPIAVLWDVAPDHVPPGDGCPICLPALAHPLAMVWLQCRRWDDNANADLVRSDA